MRYKYPKKITIGSTIFKIVYDYKSESGASFSLPDGKTDAYIRFGMLHHKKQPLYFFELLIHEIKEIIQIEQGTRLNNWVNDSFSFHYDHAQHQDLCSRLAEILSEFIQ